MEITYEIIAEQYKSGKNAVLCIVTETKGSTPRKAGAKMLVYADSTTIGTVGGGSIETQVIKDAVAVTGQATPCTKQYELFDDLSMHCGGSVNVYFEPVNPNHKLFIFGAGHIGRTLAQFAKELSFQVIVIDDRQGIFNSEEFNGCKCIEMSYLKAVEQCNFDDDSYIVIVTPKHSFDEDILAVVARKPHKYIGMIGSNKKVKMAKERFISQNILTQEELDKINMPIGIKFAVETPEEIAISILAKLIDVRNSSKNC